MLPEDFCMSPAWSVLSLAIPWQAPCYSGLFLDSTSSEKPAAAPLPGHSPCPPLPCHLHRASHPEPSLTACFWVPTCETCSLTPREACSPGGVQRVPRAWVLGGACQVGLTPGPTQPTAWSWAPGTVFHFLHSPGEPLPTQLKRLKQSAPAEERPRHRPATPHH